jgi:hypothetical protein
MMGDGGFTRVIPATQEAEMKGSRFKVNTGKKLVRSPSISTNKLDMVVYASNHS